MRRRVLLGARGQHHPAEQQQRHGRLAQMFTHDLPPVGIGQGITAKAVFCCITWPENRPQRAFYPWIASDPMLGLAVRIDRGRGKSMITKAALVGLSLVLNAAVE